MLWILPEQEILQATQKRKRGPNEEQHEGLWHWVTSAAHIACESVQGLANHSGQTGKKIELINKSEPIERELSERLSGDKRPAGETPSPLLRYYEQKFIFSAKSDRHGLWQCAVKKIIPLEMLTSGNEIIGNVLSREAQRKQGVLACQRT